MISPGLVGPVLTAIGAEGLRIAVPWTTAVKGLEPAALTASTVMSYSTPYEDDRVCQCLGSLLKGIGAKGVQTTIH